MTNDTDAQGVGNDASSATGWDRDGFWYPTLDSKGLLLGLFLILFVLHFSELLGLYDDPSLLFGWLPINFGYHAFMAIVHATFFYLLYLNWPTIPDVMQPGDPGGEE